MKPRLKPLIFGLAITLFMGCATPHPDTLHLERQRFVPAPTARTRDADRSKASFSALVPVKDGTGISRLIAHAGIGDYFPVKDEAGHCFFEVEVIAGDDDPLLLQINSIEKSQSIDLPRDKSVWEKIGDRLYDFAYPSVSVRAGKKERPTSSRAMLLLHHHP